MNAPTRSEFEVRSALVEARMDGHVAEMKATAEMFMAQAAERDKRFELTRLNMEKYAERASTLKAHLWAATLTTVLAISGTGVGIIFATQSSNLMIAQTTLAAFQQGQYVHSSR